MPELVIRVDPERRQWWKDTLSELLPGYRVWLWDEDQAEYTKDAIDYAVVWMPPLGGLASLTNLKAVFSVGAGVTHILRDVNYPRQVPIVRTVNRDLRSRMTEYVVLHVLRLHRKLPDIQRAVSRGEWEQFVEPLARDKVVGILGLGNLGQASAAALSSLGYQVHGWSRSGAPVDGVTVHSGPDGLHAILSVSDVVVCMLPGTPETTDLIDSGALSAMKPSSSLINVGRGETVVDADLIEALESGQLSAAVLDVFRQEPLPADDPLWTVENLLITCHTASAIEPATGGRTIAANILAFDAGDNLDAVVDLGRGY